MHRALFPAALVALLALACTGGGEPEPTPTSTPTPTATPTLEPSALEILRQSDEAMNQMRSLRVKTNVRPRNPEVNQPKVIFQEFVTPDRGHSVTRSEQGELQYEVVVIGSQLWNRTGLRSWKEESAGTPRRWPNYQRSTGNPFNPFENSRHRRSLMNLRVLREEALEGAMTWVISYSVQFGADHHAVTEWIAKDNYLLLRRESQTTDLFGPFEQSTEEYYDFNAPITIEPPPAVTP